MCGAYRLVVGGNLRNKDNLEDLNIDGRIIFKIIYLP